jgi:hypothetical protein
MICNQSFATTLYDRKCCSKECTNKLTSKISKEIAHNKKEKLVTEYLKYPSQCECCKEDLPFDKRKNKFCSHKCSAIITNISKIRTEEQKSKIRNTLTGTKYSEERLSKIRAIRLSNATKKYKICRVCQKSTSSTRRFTCSYECFLINTTNNALKQEKHGGGHKGRYKGIPCDSTYELCFLIYNLDHNIKIIRSTNIYSYEYKGKIRKYIPDFIINDSDEIEVKGFMSKRSIAKLTQNSHIKVVDKISIQPYIKYVKDHYSVKDVRVLYDKFK